MRAFLERVRKEVVLRDGAGLTDGQLLESYIERRDDVAFEAIVKFHGPMVLGVCRRILKHDQDAEDAFQATFLVLSKKATAVVPRVMVGNWLYGVAYRTALKAKSLSARRRTREIQMAELPEIAANTEDRSRPELTSVIDAELSELSAKYRVPIVLCDLEGKTHKEAARQLGWAEGTLSVRLMRARNMLARRLARRGLAVPALALAWALAENAASASVPAELTASTVEAVRLSTLSHAATAGVISPNAAALAEGILNSMLLTNLRNAVIACGLLTVLGLGAGGLIYRLGAAEPIRIAQNKAAAAKAEATRSDDAGANSKNEEGQGAGKVRTYPMIAKTVPEIGATEVSPDLKEIKVTFDRKMGKGMSWTGGPPLFPPVDATKKGHWLDDRTCVLPVKLEPGKYYRLGLNAQSFQNFKTADGKPVPPASLYFVTTGAGKEVKDRVRVPKIVKFEPDNGSDHVDPGTKRISITFDVPMGAGMSWTGSGEAFPKSPKGEKASWSADKLTCTLPVELEPNHYYRLGANSLSHNNFQSEWGVQIEPIEYSFKTRK